MPEATNSIHAQWRVPGDAGAAFELLARPEDWPRWWASVHARSRVLDAASAGGRGPAVMLVSHGRTPTLLRWTLAVESIARDASLVYALGGEVRGTLAFAFAHAAPYTVIDVTWNVNVVHPSKRMLLGVLRPLLHAEAGWALQQGEIGLRLEARRRAAVTAHERASVPHLAPPSWRTRALAGGRGADPLGDSLDAEPREPAGGA